MADVSNRPSAAWAGPSSGTSAGSGIPPNDIAPTGDEAETSVRAPPREQLDPRTRTVWWLNAALWAALALVTLAAMGWLAMRLGVPRPLVALGWATMALVAALGVVVGPNVLYRHWRYEIRQGEIDLQHGLLTITRTMIPMARIQHVDTQRGPLQRSFGLASVVLYTAAGASTIPGLASETADELRDRIAALAGVRDDL